MESNRSRYQINWVVLAIVLFLLIYGISNIVKYFDRDLVSVEAVIEEVQTSGTGKHRKHKAFVTYTYEGVTYSGVKLDYWHTGMNEGTAVEIRIDPNAPGKTVTKSGFISTFIGLVLGIKAVRKRKETEEVD